MNISKKTLRKLVKEVLQEFTTTDTTLGGADLAGGETSPETQDAYDNWKDEQQDQKNKQKEKDKKDAAKNDLSSKQYQRTTKLGTQYSSTPQKGYSVNPAYTAANTAAKEATTALAAQDPEVTGAYNAYQDQVEKDKESKKAKQKPPAGLGGTTKEKSKSKKKKDESLSKGIKNLIGDNKMAKQQSLKKLLEGIFEDTPQVNKYEVVEGVKSFGIVGKTLYNNSNIMEIAKQISNIAESAHSHVLSETNDWFDQVSVNKNMQSLKKRVAEFKKTAQESHQLNQRLTGLYEDMGHILNRYYDINEDSGDMDGDGVNEPDSEEYMDNKDKAIKNAMGETVNDPDGLAPDSPDGSTEEMKENLDGDKTGAKDGNDNPDQYADSDGEEMKEVKRSLKDIGGVVGIPSLGQIARKYSGK